MSRISKPTSTRRSNWPRREEHVVKLTVNGESADYEGEPTLAVFLLAKGADPDRVAVMVNDEIVPRVARAARVLRDGDRVEILVFAGGG